MEGGRGFFDASVYMLFEASGDSEAPLCIDGGGGASNQAEFDAAAAAAVVAEDDAQSCSYGSVVVGGGYCENETIDATEPDDNLRGEVEDDDDNGGGGSDEDEDGVVDQRTAEKGVKSNGWDESNVKAINDREGDRLFWEMCLTS